MGLILKPYKLKELNKLNGPNRLNKHNKHQEQTMRIALAQINPTVGDLVGNKNKILGYIERAKSFEVDLVVFPELSLCGYPPEDLLHKWHFVEDNLKILHVLVREVKGIAAIVGFVDADKGKNLYNAAAVIKDGKLQGIYHKEELPNYGVFDEKRYFTPGEKNKIFSLLGVRFGLNICEDIWIDKAAYYRQKKQGAEFLINISSSPYDMNKLEIRERLLKRRAKETKAFIGYVNLVGGQDELVFDGCSMVVSPQGKIIALGKSFDEDLVVVDLPLRREQKKMVLEKPSFGKESSLERMYKALVLGTKDYINKNGFKKVLVGLSGGIDSSLVAAIACDAIGKENVVGVSMPSRFSSEGTRNDAQRVAQNLGIEFKEISIEPIFKAYLEVLKTVFEGLKPDLAEENIQARVRGNILMALSNKFGWLVLTTGNKSEVAVGYCTLYGDMSGGFAVIKDVPKTKVYDLVKLRNAQGKETIPQSIIDRAPTAELKSNQKDQDTLPPYDVLDKLLEGYVEKHQSFRELEEESDKETVKRVIKMVDKSEYKRRQAAPGIKITPRAFGKDWRLPITNKYKEF